MKRLYMLLALLHVLLVKAQIPNPSFEYWNNGLPDGWYGVNNPDTLFVQSYFAYTDTYALRMNVSVKNGVTIGGDLFTGADSLHHNFPISYAPGALHGWYIASPATAADGLFINSNILAGNSTVGNIAATITSTTLVYKQFAFNYAYNDTLGIDSASIEFAIQNQGGNLLGQGTYFIIDDLFFGGTVSTGINDVQQEANLEQCLPNPASQKVNFIYSLTGNSSVNMVLYDVTGQKVKLLLDNTIQTPGRYKIPADVSELPAGVYFCHLCVNGRGYENKLLVSR